MRRGALLLFAVSAVGCWGSAVPQDAACATFVTCTRALDVREGRAEADLLRYEEGGFCWNNPNFAASCTTSCERALERLRVRQAGLPEACVP